MISRSCSSGLRSHAGRTIAVADECIPSAADLLILALLSLTLGIEVEPLLILVGIAVVIAAVEDLVVGIQILPSGQSPALILIA